MSRTTFPRALALTTALLLAGTATAKAACPSEVAPESARLTTAIEQMLR